MHPSTTVCISGACIANVCTNILFTRRISPSYISRENMLDYVYINGIFLNSSFPRLVVLLSRPPTPSPPLLVFFSTRSSCFRGWPCLECSSFAAFPAGIIPATFELKLLLSNLPTASHRASRLVFSGFFGETSGACQWGGGFSLIRCTIFFLLFFFFPSLFLY